MADAQEKESRQLKHAQHLIDEHTEETGHDGAYQVGIGEYTPIVTVTCTECEETML
jgi:hypothetical protein